PPARSWKWDADAPGRVRKIQQNQREFLGLESLGRRAPVIGDDPIALQGLLKIVERLAAPQASMIPPEQTESAVQSYQRRPAIVVEIFPVCVAAQLPTGQSRPRKLVVIGKLLTLPQHRDALQCIERDRIRLQLVKLATVSGRQRAVHRAGEHDELAMIV